MPDSYYTAAVVADINYRRAGAIQDYKSQDGAAYRGADAHNHGLFYPNKIILCRDMAVLAAAAGVIALGVLPADTCGGSRCGPWRRWSARLPRCKTFMAFSLKSPRRLFRSCSNLCPYAGAQGLQPLCSCDRALHDAELMRQKLTRGRSRTSVKALVLHFGSSSRRARPGSISLPPPGEFQVLLLQPDVPDSNSIACYLFRSLGYRRPRALTDSLLFRSDCCKRFLTNFLCLSLIL